MTERRLLKTPEAAAYLGLETKTLENWRYLSASEGPPWVPMPGRAIRYDVRDLDAWIEARKTAAA